MRHIFILTLSLILSGPALSCEDESAIPPNAARGTDLVEVYALDKPRPNPSFVVRDKFIDPSLSPWAKTVLTQPEAHLVVQAYIKGQIAEGDEILDHYFESAALRLRGPIGAILRNPVRAELLKLSQDRELRDAIAEGQTDPRNGFYVPYYFLKNAFEHRDLKTFTSAANGEVPLFNFSPQSIEMMRLLLEYGDIKFGSNILEFGYGGNLSILKVLTQLPHPMGNIVGVDLDSKVGPRPGADAAVAPIELLDGDPLSTNIASRVRAQGPFKIIYALDTFRPSVSYGIPFIAAPTAHFYLKNLATLLADGGRIILLNDFEAPSLFSESDVKRAGLSVIELNKKRQLRPAELAFMQRAFPGAGMYRFSVFQKGRIPVGPITHSVAVPKASDR